jgi:hypothetical protein
MPGQVNRLLLGVRKAFGIDRYQFSRNSQKWGEGYGVGQQPSLYGAHSNAQANLRGGIWKKPLKLSAAGPGLAPALRAYLSNAHTAVPGAKKSCPL